MILSKADVKASVLRDDFYEFVKEFWGEIIPDPPVWNWHIKYICKQMQRTAKRVKARKEKKFDILINIPPGSTKSTVCSVMFPAWVWTWFSTARFNCGSHTSKLTMDLALKTRDLVDSRKYKELFRLKIREDQSTKGYFLNTRRGGRLATTVGSKITGFHAHFIIIDDPIDPEGARSEQEMKVANRWMTETIPSRVINKSLVPIILIMQRLHQDDPSANMLERAKKEDATKVRHICIPATSSKKVRPKKLKAYYKDGLFDPIRLDRRTLNRSKTSLGDYGYSAQYEQNPIPEGGGFFKADRITIEDCAPARMQSIVRYWDKAGSKGKGAYSSGVKIGKDMLGRFWILDVKRFREEAVEREVIIRQTAMVDGELVRIGVEQEPGSGGKESAQSTVRNLPEFIVVLDRATGDKVTRAEPMKSQVYARNFYMVKAPWNKDYLDELGFFPFSKYKDQVDASSGAYNLVNKPVIKVGAFRANKKTR